VPVVLCFILLLPTQAFSFVMGAILLIGAWEWSNFMKLEQQAFRVAYVGLVALVFWLGASWSLVWVLTLALIFWSVALYWVVNYPHKKQQWASPMVLGAVGLLVLYPGWLALSHLHSVPSHGPWLLIYVITLVAVADIGAYFAGKRFGNKKLAPEVSPGKSVAGLAGGFVASSIFALIVSVSVGMSGGSLVLFLISSQSTALISVLGDLLESMIKRHSGV